MLWRSDWFAYPSDHYGAINPADHHYAGGSLTTDPATLATVNGSSNEVMFKNGPFRPRAARGAEDLGGDRG